VGLRVAVCRFQRFATSMGFTDLIGEIRFDPWGGHVDPYTYA